MDVECPYCGKEVDISHDDGYGYEEGEAHQQQCTFCDKYFVYYTSIMYSYDAEKADCLNDGKHDWEPQSGYPRQHFIGRFSCTVCGEEQRRDEAGRKEAMQALYGKD